MGLLSWWRGKSAPPPSPLPPTQSVAALKSEARGSASKLEAEDASGMNGAVEVRRPGDVTVFEFGSVAASGDQVTLAGYCPVSEELEPCRWEIVRASGSDAPQFRIVF